MRNFILCCLIGGWMNVSFAQMVYLSDLENHLPIEGVELFCDSLQASAITNSKGQVDISAFKGGETIFIRLLGYKPQVLSYAQIQSANCKIALDQTSLHLDEVIVSSTKWYQKSTHTPVKISSISDKEVALQNPQTAADLLGISGKVFIQKSQQGGGSPMIRGFAANRLNYSVDGVRMNTAIFRGGNLQNVINLDPFAIESTEVLFGPGSVIYGSDAIGGVMSFQTLKPQFSINTAPFLKGKANLRHSSANLEKTGHLDVNVGWKKWAFVTSFSSWNYDHLRQGNHGPVDYIKSIYPERQNNRDVVITQDDPLLQIPSAYSQANLMQKVRFSPNDNWDFQLAFHYSETSPYGRYDRHNRFKNGTLRYAEWDYGPQTWLMNNVNISHTRKGVLYNQMSCRFARQSFEESRIDRTFDSDKRNTQWEKVEAYSVNLDFKNEAAFANTLCYGFEYVRNDVRSEGKISDLTNGLRQKGISRYPLATWHSLAVYCNDEFKLSPKLIFQAGLRYNQFILDADFRNNIVFYPFPVKTTTINNDAFTGSLGGVYKPGGSYAIKANLATAFRAPNVDDVGKVFDAEPHSVTVPNPHLKAEYAYNFDLGLAKLFGDVVKVELTGFYTILQNAMVRRDYRLSGEDSISYKGEIRKVQAIQNAAKAYVYGLQAGIEVKFLTRFTFLSDFNYQKGEEELDDGSFSPLRHAAPVFGISRLRYKQKRLSIDFNLVYQAEKSFDKLPQEEKAKNEIYAKDKNGHNYSPAWYTLNLKAQYQLFKSLSIGGGIENLTDQRYRPYSSGISGAGRNYIISLNARF